LEIPRGAPQAKLKTKSVVVPAVAACIAVLSLLNLAEAANQARRDTPFLQGF